MNKPWNNNYTEATTPLNPWEMNYTVAEAEPEDNRNLLQKAGDYVVDDLKKIPQTFGYINNIAGAFNQGATLGFADEIEGGIWFENQIYVVGTIHSAYSQ